jgi:hypothetical protein
MHDQIIISSILGMQNRQASPNPGPHVSRTMIIPILIIFGADFWHKYEVQFTRALLRI